MSEKKEYGSEIERAKQNPSTKAEAAMSLLLSGASFADIARLLEYASTQAAKNAVERSLASTVTIDDKKSLQKIAARRYEALLKSVMPRATNPKDSSQLAFNQRAQALVDRIVKLQGLEEATQIQITPSDEYLQQYTARMMESLGMTPVDSPEADILEEADIIG